MVVPRSQGKGLLFKKKIAIILNRSHVGIERIQGRCFGIRDKVYCVASGKLSSSRMSLSSSHGDFDEHMASCVIDSTHVIDFAID